VYLRAAAGILGLGLVAIVVIGLDAARARGVPSPAAGVAAADPSAVERGVAAPRTTVPAVRVLAPAGEAAPARDPEHERLLRLEAELEAAVARGVRDRGTYRRLAATVASLAEDWAVSEAERRALRDRERVAWRGLLAAEPDDAEAHLRLALLTTEPERRVAGLSEAARRAPRDPRPRRALGEELLERGDADAGARLLVEAAGLYDREGLASEAPDLLHLLRRHGREQEEAQVKALLESLP
jgi:hypothetical protein